MSKTNSCFIHIPKSAGSSIWNGWVERLSSLVDEHGHCFLIDDVEYRHLRFDSQDEFKGHKSEIRAHRFALASIYLGRSNPHVPPSQKLIFHLHRPFMVEPYIEVDQYILPMRDPIKRLFSHLNDIYATAMNGEEPFSLIKGTKHFCPDISRELLVGCQSYMELMKLLSGFFKNYTVRYLSDVFGVARDGPSIRDVVLPILNRKLFVLTFTKSLDSEAVKKVASVIDPIRHCLCIQAVDTYLRIQYF